jgi:hypothetical protein
MFHEMHVVYDVVCSRKPGYDIVGLSIHVIYDSEVVGAYRIQCRRSMLWTYNVVYFIQYHIFLTFVIKPTTL